jgi:hypothetical protein
MSCFGNDNVVTKHNRTNWNEIHGKHVELHTVTEMSSDKHAAACELVTLQTHV